VLRQRSEPVRARRLRGMIGCAAGVQCGTKESFNGDGAVVSYLNIICTKGADDMSDHEKWISYSHWGMFTLERKPSRQSN
jgi:hypothetical protein